MAAGVDRNPADFVLVIDVSGAQVARRIPSGIGDVAANIECGVARIAHRVVLVAHIGQVDLQVMRRGAAAQHRKAWCELCE